MATASLGADERNDLGEVGITGYPDSHAFISDETTIQATFDKAALATYIVSQICFDAEVIGTWIRRVRDRGGELPIHIGLPGPVAAGRLLWLSGRLALGESARFLRRRGNWVGRLLLPGAYRPDALLKRLAPDLARPDNRGGGSCTSTYTFNEIQRAESWRREAIAGLARTG